ncbi:RNA methyltransferase [Calothrix sp. UHCC 0171]|uniref:RNA methyltransferase n=1 Tax=Calothrix sp. UHCC 0171 TaxID=3110245 RepID=UPI002B20C330|nr:RNA methyltransferase [Calothrix sp. UHCC 0171]MEA5574340.1 RNA methyltransferase [Calothrix sp. UHCC 0171]
MLVSEVRIILVEPAGALNVGSVARAMKNFGQHQLILVNPRCDYLGEEAKLMAVHAQDILTSAVVVTSLPEALQGCKRAIATTGINHDWDAPLESPRTAFPWLLESVGQPSALIFGREDRGLSNQELNYAQKFVRIPSSSEYASLNLAAAVGICCYELSQIADLSFGSDMNITGDKNKHSSPESELAHLDIVESYYQQLELLLLQIGYLYPHTAASRMEKLRQLYNRAELRTRELSMLRGMLRQIEWAIGSKSHE